MPTVTSAKVQASFGEIADMAKGGDPVTITQYGRPTLMLMRYQDGVDAMRQLAAKRLAQWMDARADAEPVPANGDEAMEQLNALIDDERAR